MNRVHRAEGLNDHAACCCRVDGSDIEHLFEATLYSTRIGSLEAERAEGKHVRLAERFIAMKANIARPTSAILILNTIANTAGATLCGMYAAQMLGSVWVPAFSVGLTVAILFVGEILPKTSGRPTGAPSGI